MSASKRRLYWQLQLAAHFMQKQADRGLIKDSGITTAQFGVLSVIANGDEVTQKDVATRLGLNQSAITAMVRRLMKMGFVDRMGSRTDGRTKILSLTKEGQAIFKNTSSPFRKINQQIEATLDSEEIELFADSLEKITDAFR